VTDISLDTTGLNCPLPFLRLRKAIRTLAAGTRIEVLSTDPLAPADFRELCNALGHQLVSTTAEGAVSRTLIIVGAAVPSLKG